MNPKNHFKSLYSKLGIALFALASIFCAFFAVGKTHNERYVAYAEGASIESQVSNADPESDYWLDYATEPEKQSVSSLGSLLAGGPDFAGETIYKIISEQELAWVSLQSQAGGFAASIALAADIDMDGRYWTPINNFTGNVYGGGHYINGLHTDDGREGKDVFPGGIDLLFDGEMPYGCYCDGMISGMNGESWSLDALNADANQTITSITITEGGYTVYETQLSIGRVDGITIAELYDENYIQYGTDFKCAYNEDSKILTISVPMCWERAISIEMTSRPASVDLSYSINVLDSGLVGGTGFCDSSAYILDSSTIEDYSRVGDIDNSSWNTFGGLVIDGKNLLDNLGISLTYDNEEGEEVDVFAEGQNKGKMRPGATLNVSYAGSDNVLAFAIRDKNGEIADAPFGALTLATDSTDTQLLIDLYFWNFVGYEVEGAGLSFDGSAFSSDTASVYHFNELSEYGTWSQGAEIYFDSAYTTEDGTGMVVPYLNSWEASIYGCHAPDGYDYSSVNWATASYCSWELQVVDYNIELYDAGSGETRTNLTYGYYNPYPTEGEPYGDILYYTYKVYVYDLTSSINQSFTPFVLNVESSQVGDDTYSTFTTYVDGGQGSTQSIFIPGQDTSYYNALVITALSSSAAYTVTADYKKITQINLNFRVLGENGYDVTDGVGEYLNSFTVTRGRDNALLGSADFSSRSSFTLEGENIALHLGDTITIDIDEKQFTDKSLKLYQDKCTLTGSGFQKSWQTFSPLVARIESVEQNESTLSVNIVYTLQKNHYTFSVYDLDSRAESAGGVNGHTTTLTDGDSAEITFAHKRPTSFEMNGNTYELDLNKQGQAVELASGNDKITYTLSKDSNNNYTLKILPYAYTFTVEPIEITINVEQILYDLSFSVVNGYLTDQEGNTLSLTTKTISVSHYDTVAIIQNDNSFGVFIESTRLDRDTGNPIVLESFVIKNNKYYSYDSDKSGNFNQIIGNEYHASKADTYTVYYLHDEYLVTVTPWAVDPSTNELANLDEYKNSGLEAGSALTVLGVYNSSEYQSPYFKFSHYEYCEPNGTTHKIYMPNDSSNLVENYKIKIVDENATSGYSEIDVVANTEIYAIFITKEYKVLFQTDKENKSTQFGFGESVVTENGASTLAVSLHFFNDNTVSGFVSNDESPKCKMDIPGYTIKGAWAGETYVADGKTNQILKTLLENKIDLESATNGVALILDYVANSPVVFSFKYTTEQGTTKIWNLSSILGQPTKLEFNAEFDFASYDTFTKLQTIIQNQVNANLIVSRVKYAGLDGAEHLVYSTYLTDGTVSSKWTSELYDHSEGALQYELIVECVNSSIKVFFDKTFLKDNAGIPLDVNIETVVGFGKNNYSNVPVPQRTGFKFVYWKAVAENAEYIIYLDDNGTIIPSKTSLYQTASSLTFFAYFEVIDASLNSNNLQMTWEYDATTHEVVLAELADIEGATLDIVATKGVNIYENAKVVWGDNRIYVKGNFTYVGESENEIVIAYVPNFEGQTGAKSSFYVTNPTKQFFKTAKVVITEKQLTIDTIVKAFDSTKDVVQKIYGLCEKDLGVVDIKASYSTFNAGADLEVTYEIKSPAQPMASESYLLPSITRGEILPLELQIDLKSGAQTVNKGSDDPLTIGSVAMRTLGDGLFTLETKLSSAYDALNKLSFSNDTSALAWEILKTFSPIINFDIVTSSGSGGQSFIEYKQDTLNNLLIQNATLSTNGGKDTFDFNNIKVNIDGIFTIMGLDVGQRGFLFTVVDWDAQDGTLVDSFSFVNTADNYAHYDTTGTVRYVIRSSCQEGDDLVFKLNYGSNYIDHWIKYVEVKANGDDALLDNASFDVNSLTLTLEQNILLYEVTIYITRLTTVTFNYSLPEGQTFNQSHWGFFRVEYNGNLAESLAKIATDEFVTSRKGFTFAGWAYDLAGTRPIDTIWAKKQNTEVVYAQWKYNNTASAKGEDINAKYSTLSYMVTPAITEVDRGVTNTISWKKLDQNEWVDVDSDLVKDNILWLKDVLDSGTYGFMFEVSADLALVDEYGQDYTENITYFTSNDIFGQFNAVFAKWDFVFDREINKIFDGYDYLVHSIVKDDHKTITPDDLIGKEIVLEYSGKNAGEILISTSLLQDKDFKLLSNYNFIVSGQIIKRDMTLKIEDLSVPFKTEPNKVQVERVVDEKSYSPYYLTGFEIDPLAITDTNFYLGNELYIYTNNINIGVYSSEDLLGYMEIFDAKTNEPFSVTNNINLIIDGSVTVTRLVADDSQVSINKVKPYNTSVQTWSVSDMTLPEDMVGAKVSFKTAKGETFTGAKDVGDYTLIGTVVSSSYEDYEFEVTLSIIPLYIDLNSKNAYSKIYDGTNLAYLQEANHYTLTAGAFGGVMGVAYEQLFTSEQGLSALSYANALKAEIAENYNFVYVDKNVGQNIKILTEKKNISYQNIQITLKNQFVGNVEYAEIVLNLNSNVVYSDTNAYEFNYSGLKLLNKNFEPFTQSAEVLQAGSLKLNKPLVVKNYILPTDISLGEFDYLSLVIGQNDPIIKNYKIIGITGQINVSKTLILVSLKYDPLYEGQSTTPSYIYTGQKVNLLYDITIKTNGADLVYDNTHVGLTNYFTVTANGINVAKYYANFALKNPDCYAFETNGASLDLVYEIVKAKLQVVVEADYYYNGLKQNHYIQKAEVTGLCAGHFLDEKARFETKYANVGVYEIPQNVNVYNLDVFYEELGYYVKVTSNYEIMLTGTVEIVKANPEFVGEKKEYTYNGQVQELSVDVDFKGASATYVYDATLDRQAQTWLNENAGQTITAYLKTVGKDHIVRLYTYNMENSSRNYTKEYDFKYANLYEVRVESVNFNESLIIDAEIAKKSITAQNILIDGESQTEQNKSKTYDATNLFLGALSSSDICQIDGLFNDNDKVVISAKYESVFGSNLALSFSVVAKDDSAAAQNIANSYVVDGAVVYGTINKRAVTLTYAGTDKYYYTNQSILVDISRFKVTDKGFDSFALNEKEYFAGKISLNFTKPDTYNLALMGGVDYSLNELSVKTYDIEAGDSSTAYYDITFAGNLTLQKAVVVVDSVSGNVATYNAKGNIATLTAGIKNQMGTMTSDIAVKILGAQYINNDTIYEQAVEAGTYYISPYVRDEFKDYYALSEQELILQNDKLVLADTYMTIGQRQITVFVERATYVGLVGENFAVLINNTNAKLVEDSSVGLLSAHKLSGMARTTGNEQRAYVFKGTNLASSVDIVAEIDISDEKGSVLQNYFVTYDITLTISDKMEDYVYVYADDLTYNAQNQAGLNILKTYDDSYYVVSAKFYSDLACTNEIDEIKYAGIYYAKVVVNYLDEDTNYASPIQINVLKKEISSYIFNGAEFNGDKVYDGTDYIQLSSNDVFEADRDGVVITATYSGADFGGSLESIYLTGSLANNYYVSQISGSVISRQVTVQLKNALNYVYDGIVAVQIGAENFEAAQGFSLVQGHSFGGNVTVNLGGVGSYAIANANGLIVQSGQVATVAGNYVLTIAENQNVNVVPLEVTLGLNKNTLTYNATDRRIDFVNNLTNDKAKFDLEIKEFLKQNYLSLFNFAQTPNGEVFEVKTAGTYQMTKKADVQNANFTISMEEVALKIEKADLTIRLGSAEIDYLQYADALGNILGYPLVATMANGLMDADSASFANSVVVVKEKPVDIGVVYYDSSLAFKGAEYITANYNIILKGSLKLTATGANLQVSSPVYAGSDADLFDQVTVTLLSLGTEGTLVDSANISKVDSTTKFTFVNPSVPYKIRVALAGDVSYVCIVKISPKPVASATYVANKVYDATNVVLSPENSTSLSSDDFASEDTSKLLLTAVYDGFMVGNHGISFTLSGDLAENYTLNLNGKTGQITKKEVSVALGELNYIYENTEKYSNYVDASKVTLASLDQLAINVITISYNGVEAKDISTLTVANGFKVMHAEIDVTDCYTFAFTGTIKIIPRQFAVKLTLPTDLIFRNEAKAVTFEIVAIDELNAVDISNISAGLQVEYQDELNILMSKNPVDAGTYSATVVSSLEKYKLVTSGENSNVIEFEIQKFEFIIDETNAPQIDAYEDQLLDFYPKSYTLTLSEKTKLDIEVTFKRVAENIVLGLNALEYYSVNNDNIEVICDNECLKNSLNILPSTTQNLVITLTGYKNGELARQYGHKDIGTFSLADFNYTAKVGDRVLLASELELVALKGNVVFNSGDVGEPYTFKTHFIVGGYKNITVETALKLTITQREITLKLAEGESYDKVYDKTAIFDKTYSITAKLDSDEQEFKIPQLSISYAQKDVGTHNLISSLGANYLVIYENNPLSQGQITKRDVVLGLDDKYVYGDLKQNGDLKVVLKHSLTDDLGESLDGYADEILVTVIDENKISTGKNLNAGSYSFEYQTKNLNVLQTINKEGNNVTAIVVSPLDLSLVLKDQSGNILKFDKTEDKTTDLNLNGRTLTLAVVLQGDDVTIESVKYTSALPGDNVPLSVVLAGKDISNYNLLEVFGNILERNIQIKYNLIVKNGPQSLEEIISNTESIQTYNYYKAITAPQPKHYEDGYDFLGWSKTAESTDSIDFGKTLEEIFTPYSETVEVYAIWEIKEFELVFDIYKYNPQSKNYYKDGSIVGNSYVYNTTLTVGDFAGEIEHYTYWAYGIFDQVYESANYQVKEEVTIKLLYMLNKHTLAFVAETGAIFSNKQDGVTYSGNQASILVFYGQKMADAVPSGALDLIKTGYTNTGWKCEEKVYTLADFANLTVTEDALFSSVSVANTYTLTLDSVGGEFNAETLGNWKYEEGTTSKVYIQVAYDSEIPTLLTPEKTGYTFTEYLFNNETFKMEVWNETNDISLTAQYVDIEYTLTITAPNISEIEVKLYKNGVYDRTLEIDSSQENVFTYTVIADCKVQITPVVELGYAVDSVNCDTTINKWAKSYEIDGFTKDTSVEFVTVASKNVVQLNVNDQDLGGLALLGESMPSTQISTYVVTDEALIFEAYATEGYEVKGLDISALNKDEITFTSSYNQAKNCTVFTVLNIKTTTTIIVEFASKDLKFEVEFINAEVVFGNIIYTQNFTTTAFKVGEVVTLEVMALYGYKYSSVAFEPANSSNYGILTYSNGTITLSGFTSEGKIVIEIVKDKFDVTFVYAEYDEINDKIVTETALINAKVEAFGTEKEYGTHKYDYQTTGVLGANYSYGYELYAWYEIVEGEYLPVKTIGTLASVKIDKNITICLVVQRITYNLTYEVHNQVGELLNLAEQKVISFVQKVRFERSAKPVTAVLGEYMTFDGWYNENTQISTNLELASVVATKDATYTAKFIGDEIKVDVEIYTDNKEASLNLTENEINALLLVKDGIVLGEIERGYTTYGQVFKTSVSGYRVYDTLLIEVGVPTYYTLATVSNAEKDGTSVKVARLTPTAIEDGLETLIRINLEVIRYEISIEQTLAGAVMTSLVSQNGHNNILAMGGDGDKVVAKYYVKHGQDLAITYNVVIGFIFKNITYQYGSNNQELYREFTLGENALIMQNILCDTTVTFDMAITKYKINFNINYIDAKATPKEVVTYYLQHKTGVLVDSNDNPVQNLGKLIDPGKDYVSGNFMGWAKLGESSENYHFVDENGLYFIEGTEKIYGLKNLSNDYDSSGIVTINLYVVWEEVKHKVNVEFLPNSINLPSDISSIFNDTVGKRPFVQDGQCLYVEYVAGTQVKLKGFAYDGYTFYGFKLDGDTVITQDNSFIMPDREITLSIYFSFVVDVMISESIVGANSATANKLTKITCISGEKVQLAVTVAEGFEFDYWLQEQTHLTDLLAYETVVYDTTTFTAVFKLKRVIVECESDELYTLSPNLQTVAMGEQLIVSIAEIDSAYEMVGLTINGDGSRFKYDSALNSYVATITLDDIKAGRVKVAGVVNVRSLNILFAVNLTGAGDIYISSNSVLGQTKLYNLGMTLSLMATQNERYRLVDILVNGQSVKEQINGNLYNFSLPISIENHFVADVTNTLTLVYEQMLWIEVATEYEGDGTKESPYLISSAENLAFMAKVLNAGLVDQYTTQLYYKVTKNLDLTERFWQPIGTEAYPFNGVFILGDYNIEAVNLDKEYEVLSWTNHIYGVFGHITQEARLETGKSSNFPLILIILAILLFIILLIIIILINRKKKQQKMQTLIEKGDLTKKSAYSFKGKGESAKIKKASPKPTLKEQMQKQNKRVKNDEDVLDNLEEYYQKSQNQDKK